MARSAGAVYERQPETILLNSVSEALDNGEVVGWFSGRMEFGPRALGGRSILGDARNTDMQTTLNLKIKFRESFRPFAPICLADDADDYFDLDCPSPYMLLVAPVREERRLPQPEGLFGIEQLRVPRSDLPAITHVDYSARVQTVDGVHFPRLKSLLEAFKERTGNGILVNTSFNVRGEPIVCTPEEAYICFMRTDMDVLVLEDCIFRKADQPEFKEATDWRKTYALD